MNTPLAALHRRRFDDALRTRGATYHRQGRVVLDDLTETCIDATVRGSRRYQVTIRDYRDGKRVQWSCTCPYSMESLGCKHQWAVLLAVDEVEAGMAAVEERERANGLPVSGPTRRASPGVRGAHAVGTAGADHESDELDDVFDEDFEDFEDSDDAADATPKPAPGRARFTVLPRGGSSVPPGWQQRFAPLLPPIVDAEHAPLVPRLEYTVLPTRHLSGIVMSVHVVARQPLKSGGHGQPRAPYLPPAMLRRLSAPDRARVSALERCQRSSWLGGYYGEFPESVSLRGPVAVDSEDVATVVPMLGAVAGRVFLQRDSGSVRLPLAVDAGEPLRFQVALGTPSAKPERRLVVGGFGRGPQWLAAHECGPVAPRDVRIVQDCLVQLDCGESVELANEFANGPIEIAVGELPAVLATLAQLPGARTFLGALVATLPAATPTGVLLVTFPKDEQAPLPMRLQFDYHGELVAAADERPLLETAAGLCRRDTAAEQGLAALVAQQGAVAQADGTLLLARERLPEVTAALVAAKVRVLAEGRRLRSFQFGNSDVTTGIDWFELGGTVAFDEFEARMPELLAKPATPEGFIELGDGSLGMLPASWLRRLQALRALGGEVAGDVVRVPSSRALLLDALLSAREQSDVVVDAAFAKLRARLAAFTAVAPVVEPASFAGTLRPYQREGLGWLRFLREFGLGGCLADDMGLGKTVQVLALLCGDHAAPAGGKKKADRRRPNLLVAPRSVLGNWLAEAARFAPGLRVLDFSAPDRWRDRAEQRLCDHDLVLTTYALLRVDAPRFAECKLAFEHAILDEAQAVKNPDSQSSKAVRLLAARHRLVLTGTPVENHLGDLWSLFEFLNPGMLGRLPAFRSLFGKDNSGEAMAQHRELVQRALRPVLLRRTKQQVLKDLPDKVEQTLWCELGPAQRKRYDALRKHYQKLLLGKGGELANDQRFVVLEALLRLRQAACHEALLPGGDAAAESAKFDELLPRLEELAAEGHKALVFSQFTSVLDLLEPLLQQRGLAFERLDGKTKRRAERVARFQQDAACPVFLISLKAGGFGLNLTAASYVFVLDPWWNPAAEMQAIDRAHRIGQQRVVNAYRLVCKGTVEERVLELQAQKKALCEAILGNERSLLQDLTRADLELLLGG